MLKLKNQDHWIDETLAYLSQYDDEDSTKLFDNYIQECMGKSYLYDEKLKDLKHGKPFFDADAKLSHQFLMALLARMILFDLSQARMDNRYNDHKTFTTEAAFLLAFGTLGRRKLPYKSEDISVLLQWLDKLGMEAYRYESPISHVIKATEYFHESQNLNDEQKNHLQNIASRLNKQNTEDRKILVRIQALIGTEDFPIVAGEVWANQLLSDYANMQEPERSTWGNIFQLCQTATGSKPTKKWLRQAQGLIEELGFEQMKSRFESWLPLIDKAREDGAQVENQEYGYYYDATHLLSDSHMDILKGLCWLCGLKEDRDLARLLATVCLSAYKKIPDIGPRAVRVGNAAVYSLGEMEGLCGVHQLAFLKVKVKYRAGLQGIEKALNAAAKRSGLSVGQLEEMGVPGYGLQSIGYAEETLGDFTAVIQVKTLSKVELSWLKSDGKPQKSIPKAVKDNYPDRLKEIKANIKDIQKMLPAQRDRIESYFLQKRMWPIYDWKAYYLDHVLVGVIARKLIWNLHQGDERQAAIHQDGDFYNIKGEKMEVDKTTQVSLWHPIQEDAQTVQEWRTRLEELQWVQVFKQAHREIYLLTDAERNTETYSNRFAAHIIKQHQFNALCSQRHWRYTLQGCWDGGCDSVASITLPLWEIRAEFWVNGVGEYGNDTSDAGIFLYLATDQVRFYPYDGGETMKMEDVPPLVLSEILRDVDLFVGVCSVGNNPEWSDGGPEGRFYDYWHSFSFGELSTSSKNRKQILERLIPRLKIKDQCEFTDRFLKVKGHYRTYKIHLGSSNILMEPNDQYLCIVKARPVSNTIYLPFEGDGILSLILSKAILLADDNKIKDSTILSQIKP